MRAISRFRLPQLSLLTKFGLVSFVLVAILGVALGQVLGRIVEDRELAAAASQAALISTLEFGRRLDADDLRGGLSRTERRELQRAAGEDVVARDIDRVAVWSRSKRVVFSRGGPSRRPPGDGLEDALAGRTSAEVEGSGSRKRVEVYAPLRVTGSKTLAGAFELDLPYAPVGAAVATENLKLYLSLIIGLSLLYAGLYRVVATASKRLRRHASENQHQAQHDALTGLPNRGLFRDLVKAAITRRPRRRAVIAVMVMDLDRFKEINDTLGHFNGDLLLQRVGPRIRSALRDQDTVARLGGDEYAVLLPDMPDVESVRHAADRIVKELREPFVAGGLSLEVEASIGIAVCPDHGDRVDALLQRADVAMYRAKEEHSGYEIYSVEHHEYSPARLALVGELRRGIDEKELTLFYQPKADLATGVITGVEGLARWQHPRRGLLAPGEFISMAEHTSLITPLTLHVLETAVRQSRAWEKEGHELKVAVNLSIRNLLDQRIPAEVARLLDRYSVKPERLELEITESMIMSDPRRALAVLTELHEMGVSLSIDDFGTGYSSLAYLKDLPVGAIKIDQSFVMDMLANEGNAQIVQSTINLGRNLGLGVVAEGVESLEVWQRLAKMGCETAQGYYLSRPVPAAELSKWLLTRDPAANIAAQAWTPPRLQALPGGS